MTRPGAAAHQTQVMPASHVSPPIRLDRAVAGEPTRLLAPLNAKFDGPIIQSGHIIGPIVVTIARTAHDAEGTERMAETGLQMGVLGPLQAQVDRKPVPLGTPKQR